VGTSLIILSA